MNFKVVVIMSTYNGAKYLKPQLDSILQQTHANTHILIRDDGSSDQTCEILKTYSQYHQHIEWINNDQRHLGLQLSYAELLKYAASKNPDYVLYADQDDVWLNFKIERLLTKILQLDNSKPSLVFSDVKIVKENLELISPSLMHYQCFTGLQKLKFKKLLLFCPSLGCTMMMNQKLLNLANQSPVLSVNHDKRVLILASLAGNIGYLPEPTLLYRQHANNLLGGLGGVNRQLLGKGNFYYLQKRYQTALDQARDMQKKLSVLSPKEQRTINNFINLFTANYTLRLINYLRFCLTPPHWKRKLGLFLSLFLSYQ